ncbi:MAG: MerR family transcriptional regulator [Pseudomonadota bacterium]
MSDNHLPDSSLPEIPGKRYFTIGEVSDLCAVKSHVLRYWEQEFTQLKPVKRRGNRRYYQRQDVLLIRQIRDLLYLQGYTIQGARQQLLDPKAIVQPASGRQSEAPQDDRVVVSPESVPVPAPSLGSQTPDTVWHLAVEEMIDDLQEIAQMLSHPH